MNVLLHTFGCKANQYDTEVVRQRLEDAGCAVVDAPEAADAAVVNSCTVTHVGEAKLRALVRRLARRNPAIRTVVMGCAAALDDGRIAALPNVARVVGGADAEAVARALGVGGGGAPGLRRFAAGSRAWLKIQDGCDEHCTFCATVLARGRGRSREPEALVREAADLARSHAEIVLTGVHIGTYGRDLGGRWTLSTLAALLVERVPDVRYRLSSVEATEVDAPLVELMARSPERLAPHLHAPLQSGSDPLLRRMGRHWYTAATYRAAIERLAERVAPLGLGADVIVGFPGETAAAHDATRRLLEALPFTYLHVFPYSQREGTAAVRLGPPVEPAAARERAAELRALGAAREAAHRAGRAGAHADLVLESRRGGVCEAVTEDYLTALVPADAPWALGRARLAARLVSRGSALWAEAA
ncbi:MAG TPA: MiaB/RimO family radical SAM methylthiotransferase [Gemmatimonadales bacterium]|nr:MiaB/RimO family radical SAM methylthiotransferase [Gemmatimonadales bacterium]